MPKISDDFFSHRPYFLCVCSVFIKSLLSQILYGPIPYIALSLRKDLYFKRTNSLVTPFLLSPYFQTLPITLLLQILGGRIHGPSPPQILGGPSPSPPKSLSMILCSSRRCRC